jgi:hypothetical protein
MDEEVARIGALPGGSAELAPTRETSAPLRFGSSGDVAIVNANRLFPKSGEVKNSHFGGCSDQTLI